MRFYNFKLTIWENLFNSLIVCVVFGIAILICHLVEKAKENKKINKRNKHK